MTQRTPDFAHLSCAQVSGVPMLLGEGGGPHVCQVFSAPEFQDSPDCQSVLGLVQAFVHGGRGTFRSGPSQHYLGPRKILIADTQQRLRGFIRQLLERNHDLALVAEASDSKRPVGDVKCRAPPFALLSPAVEADDDSRQCSVRFGGFGSSRTS